MTEYNQKLDFSQVTTALTNLDQPFPARLLRRFSDLSRKDIKMLEKVWPEVPPARRIGVLEDLEEVAENDTLVNFDDFALSVISDTDPAVRVLALRLLWECERTSLLPLLTELMMDDPDEAVRSAAASNLGKFVLMGELDAISPAVKNSTLQNLLDVVNGPDKSQVKMRALESLGYSSHQKVPALIQTAYDSSDAQWVASALYAMGHSADERWTDHILSKLESPDSDIQYEAIRAAGELELNAAREKLLEMVEQEIENDDIKFALIWSLSQIGGEEANRKLEELLEEAEDDDEIDLIERALENIELSGSVDALDMMDIDLPGKPENPYSDDEEEAKDIS